MYCSREVLGSNLPQRLAYVHSERMAVRNADGLGASHLGADLSRCAANMIDSVNFGLFFLPSDLASHLCDRATRVTAEKLWLKRSN